MAGGFRGQDSSVALLERFVLASFGSAAALTRTELEERTGLSRHVVADVVAELVARGELIQAPQFPAPGTRGRPPARYARTVLQAPVFFIRLHGSGVTSLTSVCSDGARGPDRVCAAWTAPWPAWSSSVAAAARELRPRLAVLSVPFPVADGRGAPAYHEVPEEDRRATGKKMPPRSPWLERDPRPALSELLGCPALMVNDANLAALGEATAGVGRGLRTVMHISVVEGIGAGLVVDGRLLPGAHGFSGELAHVQVTPDGPACVCGNRGCLALVTGTRSGVRGWEEEQPAELGSVVGQALAPFITAFDPDCIVTDARLGSDGQPFIAALTTELEQRCPPSIAAALTMLPGALTDAELYGALAVADAYAITSPRKHP